MNHFEFHLLENPDKCPVNQLSGSMGLNLVFLQWIQNGETILSIPRDYISEYDVKKIEKEFRQLDKREDAFVVDINEYSVSCLRYGALYLVAVNKLKDGSTQDTEEVLFDVKHILDEMFKKPKELTSALIQRKFAKLYLRIACVMEGFHVPLAGLSLSKDFKVEDHRVQDEEKIEPVTDYSALEFSMPEYLKDRSILINYTVTEDIRCIYTKNRTVQHQCKGSVSVQCPNPIPGVHFKVKVREEERTCELSAVAEDLITYNFTPAEPLVLLRSKCTISTGETCVQVMFQFNSTFEVIDSVKIQAKVPMSGPYLPQIGLAFHGPQATYDPTKQELYWELNQIDTKKKHQIGVKIATDATMQHSITKTTDVRMRLYCRNVLFSATKVDIGLNDVTEHYSLETTGHQRSRAFIQSAE